MKQRLFDCRSSWIGAHLEATLLSNPVQILRVAKALAHTAKFRSALVNGGGDMGSQREQLERPLDVLVGTPQRVMQHAGEACCGRVLSQ